MIALALVLLPALASLTLALGILRTYAIQSLLATAIGATVLAAFETIAASAGPALAGFIQVDATSRLFLAIINPVFLGVSVYVWSRLAASPELRSEVERFVPLALAFLASANVVLLSNHLLVCWIALEATSLTAAPLIIRPGMASSRQASFRYLLFSSVALGLVLLGFICFSRAMHGAGHQPTFFISALLEPGARGASNWERLGLALVLFGLGTKLGLAPMYSWLPEAYDEAPPSVAALLGAVQFNCTLVVLMRILQVYRDDHALLVSVELLIMGITSMAVSTLSIIATRNLKRLLAYAAINHAGVIAIGLGIGKAACYGLLLYVLSNAVIKAVLFLTAGKIKAHYRTKDTRRISGLIKDLPYSGAFLMIGTFGLLGFPPFGSFFGELLVLSALIDSGQILVFAAFCALITMTFVATGRTIFPMIWGEPKEPHTWPRQTFASAAPKLVFLVALVALGLYVPPVVNRLIRAVAASLEGS